MSNLLSVMNADDAYDRYVSGQNIPCVRAHAGNPQMSIHSLWTPGYAPGENDQEAEIFGINQAELPRHVYWQYRYVADGVMFPTEICVEIGQPQ